MHIIACRNFNAHKFESIKTEKIDDQKKNHNKICYILLYDTFCIILGNSRRDAVCGTERGSRAASVKATETQAIADDAQRDLNEALPALVR